MRKGGGQRTTLALAALLLFGTGCASLPGAPAAGARALSPCLVVPHPIAPVQQSAETAEFHYGGLEDQEIPFLWPEMRRGSSFERVAPGLDEPAGCVRKRVYLWRATTPRRPRDLSPDWSPVGGVEKSGLFTVPSGRYRLHIAYLEPATPMNLRTRCECRSEPFEILEPTTYMNLVEDTL